MKQKVNPTNDTNDDEDDDDEDDEGGEDNTSKSFYSEGTTDTQHTGFATEATNPVLA